MPRLLRLCCLLLVAWMAAAPAAAGPLDDAKAGGQVGERADGYLGVVGDAPPPVRALVDDINAKRRAEYQEIARRNGTRLSEVENIVGTRLIQQSPRGSYVMGADGRWIRK